MIKKFTAKINLNHLASQIAKYEGGKKNLDISQIKEVLRISLILLGSIYVKYQNGPDEIDSLLMRFSKNFKKLKFKYNKIQEGKTDA